jgi:hypothetical protein
VDAAANPFSPTDPDPARRSARFAFSGVPVEAAKTVRIADVRGEVVRVLSERDGLSGEAGMALWDGKDAGGRFLPPGLYVACFEASDPSSGARFKRRAFVALGYPR